MSDLDQYLGAIVARDQNAFAAWVAGAEPRLRGGLRSFAADVDTEAVVQETLMRVWTAAERVQLDGRPDALLRYALRIGWNLAIDEARRRRPDFMPNWMQEELRDPGEERVPAEVAEAVRECRENLPPKPRQAIDARIEGGWRRDEELARRLGMTLNTFFQNIKRAREAIRDCLESRGVNLGLKR
jgi:RNA polymerase sigma factor (sigma-70 family)